MANEKTLGRDIISALMDETLLEGDGSTKKVAKGHLFCKIAEASSASAIGTSTKYAEIEVGNSGYAYEEITLASGDKVIDLGDPFDATKLIGFARDKSISLQTNAVDVTTDIDKYADFKSDGVIQGSGNVNGYMLASAGENSASFKLQNMFMDIVVQDSTGATVHKQRTDTVVMCYIYGKDKKTGDEVEIKILPCVFTSDGANGSYGSATGKDMAWSLRSKSNLGVLPQILMAVMP